MPSGQPRSHDGLNATSQEPAIETVPTCDGFPRDRYVAIKEIGEGGASTVYLCRDRLLGKKVAIKVLRSLTNDQIVSFQAEARLASKINHVAVVKLLDFGPADSGLPFMVMDYFDGIPLDVFIAENGVFDVPTFKHVSLKIISALAVAHGLGIYHGDLTPGNILVRTSSETGELEVKLIDFGLARVKQETTRAASMVAGTPPFMAPDTVAGRKYDARSEVYSIGCVFYFSLTGKVPFEGETALQTMSLHAREKASPLSKASDKHFPQDVEALVAKCLEKEPADRYQSMSELEAALSDLGSSEHVHPPVSPGRGLHRLHPTVAIAVLAILCLMVVSVYLQFFTPQSHLGSSKGATAPDTRLRAASLPAQDVAGDLIRIEQRATEGDTEAQVRLGDIYLHGDRVGKDLTLAQHWYERAAVREDPIAQYKMGLLYSHDRQYGKAMKWFVRAAENGYALAQFKVGRCYRYGYGVPKDPKEAMNWFLRSAKQGCALAMTSVGELYMYGIGVEKDYKKAVDWYCLGAARGDKHSMEHLGFMHSRGLGVPQDFNQALRWYRLAADKGCPNAKYNLGTMYLNGEGVKQDYGEAMRWFSRAAKQGNAKGQYSIGYLYYYGLGVPKNPVEAMKWFQRAADKGHPEAQCYLGIIYRTGRAGVCDLKKAFKWTSASAKQGYATAQFNLGMIFEKGSGVRQNFKEAMLWYRKAADQGNSNAQYSIGNMYFRGEGVRVDNHEALRWYLLAAKDGHVAAQFNLGNMYNMGIGVRRDHKEAMKWLVPAAEHGFTAAQYNLGLMFERGLGTTKDATTAKKWFSLAAAQGNSRARERLNKISSD